jgi:hypothetical protein
MDSGVPFSTVANVQAVDLSDLLTVLPALGPLAIVLFWVGILFLISRLSGWSRLAERYAATGTVPSEVHRFRSAKVGWAGYNNCLTVGGDMRGLYLAMFPLFRPGHTPLFVPWHDVEAVAGDMWVVSYVEFRFRQVPGVRVRFARSLGEAVVRSAGGAVTIREDENSGSSSLESSIKSVFASWS